jgi:hypothetical protein
MVSSGFRISAISAHSRVSLCLTPETGRVDAYTYQHIRPKIAGAIRKALFESSQCTARIN